MGATIEEGATSLTERDFLADTRLALEVWAEGGPSEKAYERRLAYVKRIEAAGLTTYQAAYDVLGNRDADIELLRAICEMLHQIAWLEDRRKYRHIHFIDRRKIAPSLLTALQSRNVGLKIAAVELCYKLKLKRAVPRLIEIAYQSQRENVRLEAIGALAIRDPRCIAPLVDFACNQAESGKIRNKAIDVLAYEIEPRKTATLLRLMQDETDAIEIRVRAMRALAYSKLAETVPVYVSYLSRAEVELRWAAMDALNWMVRDVDLSPYIALIDHLAATDFGRPAGESTIASLATRIIEWIWYQRLGQPDDYKWDFLISPVLEYADLDELTDLPQTTLAIDPVWLAEQLRIRWPGIQIGVREPSPTCLILDWLIPTQTAPMMGGLHRNGYWMLIAGVPADDFAFTAWYRSLVSAEYTLYVYDSEYWGVEIKPGMTAAQVAEAVEYWWF